MRELIVILSILFLFLFSCYSAYYKEDTYVFLVSSIDEGWGNYKLQVKLVRAPRESGEVNEFYLLTNDLSIRIGDKFKLKKVEE